MSEEPDPLGPPETSHSNFVLSVIGALGSLLLFALIIFLAYYLPASRQEPVMDNATPPAEREEKLAAVEAKAAETAESYGVVNAKEGMVRVPVERAMELVVPRLNEETGQEKSE